MTLMRNDPCHCGSKKKYKQCCMKADEASKRLARSTTDVTEVVTPQMIPYFFWKEWNSARARGDYGLLYDMTHEDGTYREGFSSREEYYTKAQGHPVPSGPDWMLEKILLDEGDARVLYSRGARDRRSAHVDLQLMHLRRTADGWRVYDVQYSQQSSALSLEEAVSFDHFGVETLEAKWLRQVKDGYERPDLADRPEPEAESVGEEALDGGGEDAPAVGEDIAEAVVAAEEADEPVAVGAVSSDVDEHLESRSEAPEA